jgi:hypothetical protein
MNQLDDFEKYLRDQLKGNIDPDPLMWSRLTDALERVQPWYASSALKYALTAVGAMVFGAISSYLYLDQQQTANATSKQTQTQNHSQNQNQSQNQAQNQLQGQAIGTLEGGLNATVKGMSDVFPNDKVASLPNDAVANDFANTVENPIENQVKDDSEDLKLPLLATNKINIAKQALQQTQPKTPGSGLFELSIASGQTWANLPAFNYQLGPQGLQQASIRLQQSPQLLVQARVYKNWHFQTGLQYLQSELTEHFYQTDVFSYDEKEHYLFPYIYGYRQISDEELNGGPWPFGPSQPGGPEISHVKADFTSVLRKQQFILPFTIGYSHQFGAFAAQINAGMALCFDSKTSQSLRIPGYFPSTVYFKAANGHLQTFAQGQLRLSYKANQHLSIYLEPQLRTSLQQQYLVHAAPYRTNTKALFAGLSWNF